MQRHVHIGVEQDPPPASNAFNSSSLASTSQQRWYTRRSKKGKTPSTIHDPHLFSPEKEANPKHREDKNRNSGEIDEETAYLAEKASTVQIRDHP